MHGHPIDAYPSCSLALPNSGIAVHSVTISEQGHSFSVTQYLFDPFAQIRQQFLPKPRIARKPAVVGWTRVRQGHKRWPIFAPVLHGQRHPWVLFGQVVCQGVLANHQRKALLPQRRKQWRTPLGRALGPGRQIPRWALARIAQAHGHNGEQLRVVELLTAHAQPIAQTVAAGIVERNARFMHLAARSLGRNEYPGRWMKLQNRPRAQRQMRGAQGAGPDLGQQGCNRRCEGTHGRCG